MGIGTFDLHGQILCVVEGFSLRLLCIHNVGMGTFVLHGLILSVSEGLPLELLGIHNVMWALKLLTFMN